MERHTKYEIVIICFLFILLFMTSAIAVSIKMRPREMVFDMESFETTDKSVLDTVANNEMDVNKILSDLYSIITPDLEKQYMCGLINGSSYKANLFGILILLDAMKVESETMPNSIPAYNVNNLSKASSTIKMFLERLTYSNSPTMRDIYILTYGNSCSQPSELNGIMLDDELRAFKEASYKKDFEQMELSDTKERRAGAKRILCQYYNGQYQESIKTVISILVSITYFYSRRLKKEMKPEEKSDIDTTIFNLNTIWKHADDINRSTDIKKKEAVRSEYCS